MDKSAYLAELLRTRIEYEDWPGDGLLPPVRHIARRWDTTIPTVLKALRRLVSRGLLEQGGNGRYRVVGSSRRPVTPFEQAVTPYRGRDEEIARAIRVDILSGVHERGDYLPSVKALRERFGCSHPSISRALARLREEGYLERIGTRHRLREAGADGGGTARVVLTGATGIIHGAHAERFQFITGLERELRARRWGPLRLFLADDPAWGTAPPDHLVAALIHFGHQRLSHNWHDFFRTRPAIPLVVVDHTEMIRWSLPRRGKDYWVLPDNRAAGREVARVLRAYGHRHVALFCQVPLGERWARLRIRGVEEIFGAGAADSSVRLLRGGGDGGGGPEALRLEMERLRMRFAASPLASLPVVKERFDRLHDLRDLWTTALSMEGCFAETFADSSISAWICINDDLALTAKAYLERRGVSAGREVSLIGFDNSPASYGAGIASYDFAFDRMGHIAIGCLDAPSSVPMDEEGVVRIRGRVVTRPSLGVAR
jgi:DNA-binding LacI/PurR family transcriptional regulator/DNA-binding transcriptional regulator YhcF (GntR family)